MASRAIPPREDRAVDYPLPQASRAKSSGCAGWCGRIVAPLGNTRKAIACRIGMIALTTAAVAVAIFLSKSLIVAGGVLLGILLTLPFRCCRSANRIETGAQTSSTDEAVGTDQPAWEEDRPHPSRSGTDEELANMQARYADMEGLHRQATQEIERLQNLLSQKNQNQNGDPARAQQAQEQARKIDELQQSLARVQGDLEQKTQLTERLQRDNETLQETHHHLEQAMQGVSSTDKRAEEYARLEAQVTYLTAQREHLQQLLDNEALQGKHHNLDQAMQDVSTDRQPELADLRAQLTQAREDRDYFRGLLEEAEKNHQNELAKMTQSGMDGQPVKELQLCLEQKTSQFKALQQEYEIQTRQVGRLHTSKSDLQSRLDAAIKRWEDQNSELAAARQDRNTLKEEVERLTRANLDLEEKVQSASTDNNRTTSELAVAKQEQDDLLQALKDLNAKNRDLAQRAAEAERKTSELGTVVQECAKLKDQVLKLTRENSTLQQSVQKEDQESAAQVRAWQLQCEQMQGKVKAMETLIGEASRTQSSKDSALEILRQQVSDAQKELKKARSEFTDLNEIKKERDALQAQVQFLTRTKEELERQQPTERALTEGTNNTAEIDNLRQQLFVAQKEAAQVRNLQRQLGEERLVTVKQRQEIEVLQALNDDFYQQSGAVEKQFTEDFNKLSEQKQQEIEALKAENEKLRLRNRLMDQEINDYLGLLNKHNPQQTAAASTQAKKRPDHAAKQAVVENPTVLPNMQPA